MSTSIPRVTLRRMGAFTLAAGCLAAAACGQGTDAQPPVPNEISQDVPSYYGEEYAAIIDGARQESGTLTVYSDTSAENWEPIFRDFKRKYPFVEQVSAVDLDSDEVFERVLSESATSGSPADIVEANAPSAWAAFFDKGGKLMAYSSPELSQLPEFATPAPNVIAMSVDPMGIVYNTALLPTPPASLSELAQMVSEDPSQFKDKITTRDIESSFGFSVSEAFAEHATDAWKSLEAILPLARPETSSGTQVEKIVGGEYVAGFFISAAPAYPVVANSGGLVEFVYPSDGTVVIPRGVGIAETAPNPNTAKLFLDFVASEEGQRAVAEGGLTSYRNGVEGPGLHTYQELVSAVGEDNLIFLKYSNVDDNVAQAFNSRWQGLMAK